MLSQTLSKKSKRYSYYEKIRKAKEGNNKIVEIKKELRYSYLERAAKPKKEKDQSLFLLVWEKQSPKREQISRGCESSRVRIRLGPFEYFRI